VTADLHGLQRFVDAQASVYDGVCAELRAGRKRGHWMWFIFPQIAGLGYSETARYYAISSLEEARAYLAHPVLGSRLIECTQLMLGLAGTPVREILGYPDDLKFRSSMTLFSRAASEGSVFQQALGTFFDGEPDPRTLERLVSQ
jgi:uncharacterized protein (DUF1810 family)